MTYEQARKDHEILFNKIAPAYDMTGGYVDQEDLQKLLESPTKATAKKCYIDQIRYWFFKGAESGVNDRLSLDEVIKESYEVVLIAERYSITIYNGEDINNYQ